MQISTVRAAVALAVLMVGLTAAGVDAQPESIALHGDWVIEVRDPDGTIVSRTVFKNALEEEGVLMLGRLLLGAALPRGWQISAEGAQVPPRSGNGRVALTMSQSDSRPLSLMVAPGGNAMILEGRATPNQGVDIEVVGTSVTDTFRGEQAVVHRLPFTRKMLSSPVRVNAGQTVTIQVTFTFS